MPKTVRRGLVHTAGFIAVDSESTRRKPQAEPIYFFASGPATATEGTARSLRVAVAEPRFRATKGRNERKRERRATYCGRTHTRSCDCGSC